jgi:RNA polymerase sigma-70 factor (ECF subfamily)
MSWRLSGSSSSRGLGREEPKKCDRTSRDTDYSETRAQFETIWRLHLSELLQRSLAWTNGHYEDAEDAVAEAAMTAFQKLPPNLDAMGARHWLLHLAYTKCMDIYRKRKLTRRLVQEAAASSDSIVVLDERSPESTALESELETLVRGWIRQMPPRLRSVAELYFLREMRYDEIATALAITQVNARKRLQEARALLCDVLRAYEAGEASLRPVPAARGESRGKVEVRGETSGPPLAGASWSIGALRAYVRKHPRGWRKHWELAVRLRQAGEHEEAVGLLREALERKPLQTAISLELGEALTALGRTGEALEVYRAALCRVRDQAVRERLERQIEIWS